MNPTRSALKDSEAVALLAERGGGIEKIQTGNGFAPRTGYAIRLLHTLPVLRYRIGKRLGARLWADQVRRYRNAVSPF